MPPSPRVDLDTSVGYALRQTVAALRSAMDAALRPLGLSVPQYACLELLGHNPGISSAELARGAFVTRQSMQTVLQALLDRGLLTRPPTAPRGRALPSRLTPAGAQLLARASGVVAEIEHRMLAPLPDGRPAQLRRDLTACATALQPEP